MKLFDIYIDGKYKRSILATNKNRAFEKLKDYYPSANITEIEIKERNNGF